MSLLPIKIWVNIRFPPLHQIHAGARSNWNAAQRRFPYVGARDDTREAERCFDFRCPVPCIA